MTNPSDPPRGLAGVQQRQDSSTSDLDESLLQLLMGPNLPVASPGGEPEVQVTNTPLDVHEFAWVQQQQHWCGVGGSRERGLLSTASPVLGEDVDAVMDIEDWATDDAMGGGCGASLHHSCWSQDVCTTGQQESKYQDPGEHPKLYRHRCVSCTL